MVAVQRHTQQPTFLVVAERDGRWPDHVTIAAYASGR